MCGVPRAVEDDVDLLIPRLTRRDRRVHDAKVEGQSEEKETSDLPEPLREGDLRASPRGSGCSSRRQAETTLSLG